MNTRRIGIALAGAAMASMVVAVAPARAADRVIAAGVTVDAYGGNLVWSVESSGPVGPLYLRGPFTFVRDGRGTRRILNGRSPMDLDLGARRGGGAEAVFRDSTQGSVFELFGYGLRSGAIRSLRSLWRPPGFEHSPSVWKGRYAFVRREEDDAPVVRPGTTGLFVTGPLRRVTPAITVATDLRGSRLAYVTRRNRTTTLYVARIPSGRGRVRSCFVARATNFAGARPKIVLSDPALSATHVYWRRKDARAPGATIRRRRLPGRRCSLGGREGRSREIAGMDSFATDRGRFFYTGGGLVREATDPRITFTR